jgi:hypothetical protein
VTPACRAGSSGKVLDTVAPAAEKDVGLQQFSDLTPKLDNDRLGHVISAVADVPMAASKPLS